MKIVSSFSHPPAILNLYDFLLRNTEEDILKTVSVFFFKWKSMSSVGLDLIYFNCMNKNCWNIIQNIFVFRLEF